MSAIKNVDQQSVTRNTKKCLYTVMEKTRANRADLPNAKKILEVFHVLQCDLERQEKERRTSMWRISVYIV